MRKQFMQNSWKLGRPGQQSPRSQSLLKFHKQLCQAGLTPQKPAWKRLPQVDVLRALLAQQKAFTPHKAFATLDSNGNGFLTSNCKERRLSCFALGSIRV